MASGTIRVRMVLSVPTHAEQDDAAGSKSPFSLASAAKDRCGPGSFIFPVGCMAEPWSPYLTETGTSLAALQWDGRDVFGR
jgi:hypothetical protein